MVAILNRGKLVMLCLLVFVAVVSHRHLVECAGGQEATQLLINWPSSDMLQGTVLHTFPQPLTLPNQLLTDPLDCPADTFVLGGPGNVNLLLLQNITFEEPTENPTCVRNADSAIGFISIKTYKCAATLNDMTTVMPFTVNVQPEFHNTRLTFQRTFYSGWVVEGLANTSVSLATAGTTPQTEPRVRLLIPQYRLTGEFSHLFRVRQQQTGCTAAPVVETAQPLDREAQSYYEVTLEAFALYAPSLISSSTSLGIRVLDANDNPPEFNGTLPNLSRLVVPVGSDNILPGTRVAQYHVTDADVGINGETLFSVLNETTANPFTIHPLSGWVYPFVPVEQGSSVVSLRAQDLGEPSQFASPRSLSIFIDPSSDATLPQIHIHGLRQSSMEQQGTAAISELASTGDAVATIKVIDPAAEDLSLSTTNIGPCECFALSSPTPIPDGLEYTLLVAETLDFESTPSGQYLVVLNATNSRSSAVPLASTFELQVEVTDDNEPPHFPAGLSRGIEVMEGVPLGTNIGRVMASDPDGGMNGTLTYSISNPGAGSLFEIDPSSGLLHTLTELDAESLVSAEVTVMVVDGGGLSSTTVLNVSIVDRNDNPPSFLTPSSGEGHVIIPEDHPWDEPIFQFVALDTDSGCNGALEYSILHADHEAFHLDPSSGLLYPSSPSALDYESFQAAILVVKVTDLGLAVNFSVETTLRVSLTDINDEVPVLDPIGCPCFIGENLLPSSPEASCPTLSAHDRDSAELTFEISANSAGLFRINSATGVVSTNASLDREVFSHHTLGITVSDGTHQSPQMQLSVVVVDANDHPPTLGGPYMFTVPVDASPGDFVGSLAAADADIGYNALTNHIMASGTSTSVQNTFQLDPLSGDLYTKAPLSLSMYTFTVLARDLVNTGPMSSSATVTIQRSGMKNNPPRFTFSTDHRTISEDLRTGAIVAHIAANDTDSDANGQLTYSFIEQSSNHSGLFQLRSNGMLTLSQGISGRAGNVYVMNISACDGGTVPLKDYQQLVVTVYPRTAGSLVYNPAIPACGYSGQVIEELDDASDIVQLVPAPELSSTDIRYTIVSGEGADAFEIADGGGGVPILRSRAGFRDLFTHREVVFVTLMAEYSLNFHRCSVTVVVNDINNSPPMFAEGGYTFEIYDRTPVGSAVYQVMATDADLGSNVRAVYAITNSGSPFEIDAATGIISLSGSLDGQSSSYAITVTASDNTLPPPATTTVTAVVVGTSNFSPIFTSPVSPLTLSETTRGVVATAQIMDGDGDRNQQAMNVFCIASGNLRSSFEIYGMGGELMATDGLDYEDLPREFNLALVAYDSSLNPAFGTAVIRVVLQDANEPPVFSVPVYRASVLEGSGTGTPVINVTAADRDAMENGEVRYTIPSGVPFTIDAQSGAISTSGVLTRQNRAVITFNVTASDGVMPSMSSEAEVQITLTDINDITPVFNTVSTVTVTEDTPVGSEILLLDATDGDIGVNGLLLFTLVRGDSTNRFSLNPWTGSLLVAQPLNTRDSPYTLELRVQDLGSPQRNSTPFHLTVMVTDSNDHFPVFSSAEYECRIPERASAFTEACQVSATDSDATGTQILFSLAGSSLFTINPNSGVINTASSGTTLLIVDRVEEPAYILQVSASDTHPAGRKTSTAIVRVFVVDSNDAPDTRSDHFLFYEGTPLNTLLFYAHVRDPDTPINFSLVTYGVISDGDVFRVDEQTGAVFLDMELDSAIMTEPLSLAIIGTNSQHFPPTSTTSTYTIEVAPRNENTLPPVFHLQSNPSGVWISRATSPGTHVATLNATDPEMQALRYDIAGGTGAGYFQIEPISGEVTIAFPLTAVEGSELTLEVRVLDGIVYPLPAWHELTVTLTSETSLTPFFDRPIFVISPPERSSGVVAAVRASVDGQVDTSICYSIQSGNGNQLFSIDRRTGAISMTGAGDRETQALHTFTVRAEMVGVAETSTALVVVELEDENDFRPLIVDNRFDFTVFENFPVGPSQTIVRIFAVDNDLGANGRLTYYITSPVNSPFAISPNTGDLYLVQPLNRTEASTYSITISARDNSSFPSEGTRTLTVMVEPPLASSPTPILNPIPTTSVSENTPPGERLTQATLVNPINGPLIYRIVEQQSVVSILPNSGEVYLVEPVDFEERTELRYIVEVLDGITATPTRTPLVISVTNENDNRPMFDQRVYMFSISEDIVAPVAGFPIQRVVATDRDNGDVLTYSLVESLHPSSLGLFAVNSSNGLVSLSNQATLSRIDREVLPTHTLTVSVQDSGATPLMDYTRVVITIQDANDNVPQFTVPPNAEVYVSENSMSQEVMYTVKAFDPDGGTNAQVSYTLITTGTPFAINSTTGELRLTTPLDAELQLVHRLEVAAFNPNNPAVFSTPNLNLTVRVIPELDSAPVFMTPPPSSVRENYPSYSRVAQVVSPASNRQVYYSIVAGNDLGHFLVEPMTGVVRTTTPLDREAVASYQLVVQGSFGAGFEANTTLSISVTDTNDESPVFSSPFLQVGIAENSSTGRPLANVSVVDADEGENGMVRAILILDSFAASVFSIDSSGNIFLQESDQGLDREGRFSSLRFPIYAIDSGTPTQFSTAELQIDITDENDPPLFDEAAYTFALSTPVLVGEPQFRVQALDSDDGANGFITYSISGDNSGKFSIDPATGEVSVADNYMLREQYSLTARARDGGGAVATANVRILVRPCGFRNLTFGPRSSMISVAVSEGVNTNTVIVNGSDLQIIDLQEEVANVRFSLPVETSFFRINGQTGDIIVALRLDREVLSEHRLVIQATDISDTSRVAQTQVVVTVLDVNDNAPQFSPSVYSFSVAATNVSFVGRVIAVDADRGINAEVRYSLASNPSGFFSIHQTFGFLSFSPSDVSQLGTDVRLDITATDRGANPLSSNASVFINIVDPSAPMFVQGVYAVTIPERTPTGTILVNTTLRDSSQAGGISYRIERTESSGVSLPFSVSTNGAVSLVDPGVDFEVESQRSYDLRVIARNDVNGLVGFALLTVDVTDSNDNDPVFEPSSVYAASPMETTTIGSTILHVRATDVDSAPNAAVSYQLHTDAPSLLTINSPSGEILLGRGGFDHEQNASFEFEVLAVDSGSPSRTSTAMVFLTVVNVNDNPPVFSEQLYETFVQDNDQPGPTNLFVSASDPDNLEDLVYDIIPGPGSRDFSVSDNGRINLAIANPTEVSYRLNVSAFDGLFYGYTTVEVSVEGINANSPVFNDSSYAATIIETPPEGTFVVQVFATDDDRGTNGQVTYHLHPLESCPSCFSINATTGVIATTTQAATAIDREIAPTLTILAIAMDRGSLSTIAEIVITVGDRNDNAPTFNIHEYFGSLMTGAARDTEVLTVMASDPDIGNNSKITYSIPNPDGQLIFSIDPATGVITNFIRPDNTIENGTLYIFNVSASDNGNLPMTSAVTTRVEIAIVDNEQPSFERREYSVNVSENARIGTMVLEPRVNFNTTSMCDALGPVQVVDIRMLFGASENVIITNASLDLVLLTSHQISIHKTCISFATRSVVAHLNAVVNIFVVDVNDPPMFVGVDPTIGFYLGSIRENLAGLVDVNPPIMATDRDTGLNGEVQYRLLNNQDKFFIIETDGRLFTLFPLDFENQSSNAIIVTIQAFDHGEPPQSTDISVAVSVIDENDNPPVFDQQSYSVSLLENATLRSLLFTAQVTDLDADSTHTYTISGNFFSIGEQSGEVRLALALNREAEANHTVQISATDGRNVTSANLVVTVLDSNDERPIFNQTIYEESLHENYPTGVTFAQVFATDADEGENAIVVYRQLPVTFDDNITIDNVTGEISFLVPPDYEVNPQLSFSIQAMDIFGELMSIVSVVVRLSDQNDNAPLFGRSNYSAHLLENMPAGTTVQIDLTDRVIATDADSGSNGDIAYHLEGQGAADFMISNGDIISRRSFDREMAMEQLFEIVVVATDMGSPALTSNASVLIQIGDENDNSPFFPEPEYTRDVLESTPIGTRIFNASAIDLDSESALFYEIEGENKEDFTVESENGELELFIRNNLDHENELRRQYQLTLVAFDPFNGGFNQGNATLVVNVLDKNDNMPRFNQSTYSGTTAENVSANATLVTVMATDRDNNNQALIYYAIMSAGNHPELSIDLLTGRIFVTTSLDFETRADYDLTVVATDAVDTDGDSVHEVTTRVSIVVTDVNDNPPVIGPHDQMLSLMENVDRSGVPLIRFNATDADSVSMDGTRTYNIMSGNVGGAFAINFMGDLSVPQPLDREKVEVYNLIITAFDNGSPPLSASTNITVRILDQNDNSPTGGHQEIYLYLLNGRAPVIPLGTVFVNDSDSDAVNEHRYSLLPSSGTDNIVIANSGSIGISSDMPTEGTYSFTVSISEGASPPANTTINTRIRDATEATLFNSFRMQFLRITPQQFVDTQFGSFLSRVTTMLSHELSTEVELQALSIQSSTFPSAQNTDVTLAVQNLVDMTYVSPLLVQHVLHLHRREVEGGSGLVISTVSVDPCSVEQCSLGFTCINTYEDSLSSSGLGSRSITYLGIAISNAHRCERISSSLCDAVSCPGPSTCVVAEGQRGEIEAKCLQSCRSDPCKNGGQCIDQDPGYFCRCLSGYNGRNCEVTVASFAGDSYAIFPAVTSRSFGSVSLDFRASSSGDDTAADFMSIDIVNESACLTYSHGEGSPKMQCVQSWSTLGGDEIWHSLSIDYNQTVSGINNTVDQGSISIGGGGGGGGVRTSPLKILRASLALPPPPPPPLLPGTKVLLR